MLAASHSSRAALPAQAPVIDFRYAPPSRWTAICLPDDPHKTLVREDGALLYGYQQESFEAWHFDRVVEFSAQTGAAPTSISQRTETAARGIVTTTANYPDRSLELTAFAHAEAGGRVDVVQWSVTNTSEHDILTGLHLDYHDRYRTISIGAVPSVRAHAYPPGSAPAVPTWVNDTAPDSAPADGAAVALISAPDRLHLTHPRGFLPASALQTTPHILRPRQSCSGVVFLPQDTDHHLSTALDEAWAGHALEQTRTFWDTLPLLSLPLQVPDPGVQEMLVGCARNLLQAREIKDGLPVPQVGAAVYRGLWIVDGHFILETARYLHQDQAARAGVTGLLKFVKPDGAITVMQTEPHLKETGIAIATLVRQAQLDPDPASSLKPHWPVIAGAVDYLSGLRTRADQLPADHPMHGLLPEAFADGGVAGERAEFTTTVWTIAGLRAAGVGAQLLGNGTEEHRCTTMADELTQAYRRAASAATRRTADGIAYTPTIPDGSGPHNLVAGIPADQVTRWHHMQPGSATWALCQAIWPGEILPADDPLVCQLLELFDTLDDEQGIPAETGWLPYASLWPYAASFAAHVWLYADRPDKAVAYLYAFANHAAPTRVWREEQSLTSTGNGQICGDMPHNWASAEFIRLVRHLLVFERGTTLELLPALPPTWLHADGQLRVDRTPSRFGDITLTARWQLHHDGAELSVTYARHPGAAQPDPARQRLQLPGSIRLPSGDAALQRALLGDSECNVDTHGRVTIPTTTATITARYTLAGGSQ